MAIKYKGKWDINNWLKYNTLNNVSRKRKRGSKYLWKSCSPIGYKARFKNENISVNGYIIDFYFTNTVIKDASRELDNGKSGGRLKN